MKKILILVGIVVMLAGATIAAMKAMGYGPFAPEGETAANAEEKEVDPAEAPRFVALETMVIPVFQDDRVAAAVSIDVKLRVLGAEREDTVTQLLPKLRSSFLSELHGYVPRLLRTNQGLNVSLIRKRLQYITEKSIGPNVVDDIVVQSVVDTGRS